MRRRTKIFGIISFIVIFIGGYAKFNALPYNEIPLYSGFLLYGFVFVPMFLIDKISLEARKAAKISYIFFFVTTSILLFQVLFDVLHLPGNSILKGTGVTFFLIYIIFFSRPEEGRKLKIMKDRQLAAIMFTDIVGFTRMMGADESDTLVILDENRRIQKKWIRKFRGKWLKELGDGSIVIFFTATEALLCGIAIQQEIMNENRFSVRMGIHISEILFTDDDAFGDGMNIASRITDQAGGGEICFSDGVYQNIRNREDIEIETLPSIQLKNVEHDFQLYKITIPAHSETV